MSLVLAAPNNHIDVQGYVELTLLLSGCSALESWLYLSLAAALERAGLVPCKPLRFEFQSPETCLENTVELALMANVWVS